MDALQALLTRRSIRRYTDEPISLQDEEILLKCAMNAQNTVNKRDWAFVVVRDKERLNGLSDSLKTDGLMLKNAAMAIVVCGDLDLTIYGLEDYWIEDASSAATNILIAAHALGLGAVWLGTYPQYDKVRAVARVMELPKNIVPLCVISLGHPVETKEDLSEQRYETNKIHHDKW